MHYAAYGSNLHPLRLTERIASARLVTTGFLPNWSLHFNKRSKDKSGKCTIRSGGAGVHVALFDMSAEDKLVLDKIEGLGNGYSEVEFSLPCVGECTAYVAAESHIDDSLMPYDWYKELVLLGGRSHGFPNDYLSRIDALPACQDPDRDRRVKGWQTVELVRAGT